LKHRANDFSYFTLNYEGLCDFALLKKTLNRRSKMNLMKMQNGLSAAKRQKGFTLVETVLVIGILVLTIAAIAAVAITTGASQTAQNEARLLDTGANKIRNIYSSTADYSTLDTTVAEGFELFPENMGAAPTTNTWGGTVTVVSPPANVATPAGVGDRQFEINWPNVAEESCSDFAAAQTSAIGVDVAGVPVYSRGDVNLDPINPALISANCAEGVTVTFVYGKL
jgi:type II secretory pathway pseudopilin PulG